MNILLYIQKNSHASIQIMPINAYIQNQKNRDFAIHMELAFDAYKKSYDGNNPVTYMDKSPNN